MDSTPPGGARVVLAVDGDRVNVSVDWPTGGDLTQLANLLLSMHRGKLVEPVRLAVENAGRRNGEVAGANSVRAFVDRHLARDKGRGPDRPVVGPLETFRHLAKSTLS